MNLQTILEAILMAATTPLTLDDFVKILREEEYFPKKERIEALLLELQSSYHERGIELVEVASGWRLQIPNQYGKWIGRLFEEKAPRYSRALFETLALIAYEQPITRSEIEAIRGVKIGGNIMRTLEERAWIEVVGRKEMPGRPMLYGTTTQFLDDFNLRSLDELPALEELAILEKRPMQLGVEFPES